MSRTGNKYDSLFGCNSNSWYLTFDPEDSTKSYQNRIRIPVSGPVSSRIGVYLDRRAGVLAFCSISETLTLLYRVQTTITQQLDVGVGLRTFGSSAEFIKLRNH
ncbi:hypothetical protein XENORESO_016789 [Xenotaenia resolanae]|uniref:B30.2/SPRY domain-containing protein n=1 Tax=Xenotaenia resolanae TaxID=208358 RepID=A0ABV0WGD4_9TELE